MWEGISQEATTLKKLGCNASAARALQISLFSPDPHGINHKVAKQEGVTFIMTGRIQMPLTKERAVCFTGNDVLHMACIAVICKVAIFFS